MDDSKTIFKSELYISPQIVLAALIVLGIIIYFVSDSVTEGTKLLQFSFLILTFAGSVWLADSHFASVGPWLTTMAFVILILLADMWLEFAGALYLMCIPLVLAMALLGFRGALVTSITETMLLLTVLHIKPSGKLTEIGTVVTMLWATLCVLYLMHWRTSQLFEWSWKYYQYAQAMLETARDERMEHKQIEADLLLANRELARLSNWLKAMHQLAEEARQTKERFVANVSHELRTPLNMIIGFSEIISRSPSVYGVKLPPALLADINAIQRNSQHLSKLVDDVLDLSQIESDRMALSKEWISITEIADQAVVAVQTLYASKHLYLKTDLPLNLTMIYCDSTRIRQVLINLLSNAGRFTEEGGVCVTIRNEQDTVLVSISDTGHGIAPDDQKRLFEPFYQIDSSLRRNNGGSGLGLTISKQFIEMHRGKMWLESKLGVGTTFYFSLPLHPPLPAYASADGMRYNSYSQFDGRREQSKAPALRICPRFVVLEEDETLFRLFTRHREDVEIVSVQNVADALQTLSQSPAHALIVNSASISTLRVRREQLASLPYSTPVITCWVAGESGSSQPLGVDSYLVKPVTREVLLTKLAELGDHIQTVLIVDDDREFLRLFARVLGSAERPYRVLQTTNGQRALSLLHERRPDVMLLDLMMTKMDGFQVLEQKRRDPLISKIPVIVISAKDPNGQPIVSHHLTLSYREGLSAHNLMACIRAVSEVLSPALPPAGQVQPKKQIE